MKLRPVGYIRVSTRNESQDTSIENQELEIRDRCRRKGWGEPLIIRDRMTGTTVNRPGLQRIARMAAAGEFDVLVAKDLVRMARTVSFIDWAVEHIVGNRIKVYVDEGEMDFTTPEGILTLTVLLAALRYQAAKTGAAYKQIVPFLRAQGRWLGHNPYGTMRGAERGVFEKDPITWPAVELIFERDAAGLSQTSTANELQRLGYPTQHGGLWRQGTIALILASPFYRGLAADGTPLKNPCVPVHVRPVVQKPKTGRSNSTHPFILREMLVSSFYSVTDGPERWKGGPEPWRTCTGGEARIPKYKAVSMTSNGKWFSVQASDIPDGAVACRVLKADWLEGIVLREIERLAEADSTGSLKARLSSAHDIYMRERAVQIKQARSALLLSERAVRETAEALTQALRRKLSDSIIDSLNRQLVAAETNRDDAQRKLVAIESAGPPEADVQDLERTVVLTSALYESGQYGLLRECLERLIERVDVRVWRFAGEHVRVKRGEVVIYWRPLEFLRGLAGDVTSTSLRRSVHYVLETGYRHAA